MSEDQPGSALISLDQPWSFCNFYRARVIEFLPIDIILFRSKFQSGKSAKQLGNTFVVSNYHPGSPWIRQDQHGSSMFSLLRFLNPFPNKKFWTLPN